MAQEREWIVQKYGGTSLGGLLATITASIIPQYLETHNVAVVCSAISGTSKSSGTTSLLLQAIELAISSRLCSSAVNQTIDQIRDEHFFVSQSIFEGSSLPENVHIKTKLDEDIVSECEQLRDFLLAAQVKQYPYPATEVTL